MPKEISMEKEVIALLKSAGIEALEEKLERPPDPKFGDLAFPCFDLAKVQKKNPHDIAMDVAENLNLDVAKNIVRAEAKGGYINFFFDWENIATEILKEIITKDKKYGRPEKLKRKK